MRKRNLWLAVLGCVCVLAWAGVASAQLSGAIFTSIEDGSEVNLNHYDFKADVYLNGGPKPGHCGSAGLPDGDYYFQVTDPSGKELLSQDDITCRRFTVSGGKITAYVSGGGSCVDHDTGIKPPENCGGITIQLLPYADTPNHGGVYKVWVTPVGQYNLADPNGVFGFIHAWSKTDVFKVKESVIPPIEEDVFIYGRKFYDTNTDGDQDAGEPDIEGWLIKLYQDGNLMDWGLTDENGEVVFVVPENSGVYTMCEVFPPDGNYKPTTETSFTFEVFTTNINGDGEMDFGNVCLGPGGGLTLGFWSNKNGQALFGSGDLALMVSLNLRTASGGNFNPGGYSSFRSWLLKATATNMAYMLSAQLAAMELNVFNGFVNGGALIYAPGLPSITNPAGFATVNAIMAAANAELGLHGLTKAGSPYRAYQEALKNALDNANNNKNFVQETPCPFTTPYDGTCPPAS